MILNTVFTSFQSYYGFQYTYPCFPGVSLTSSLHCILSMFLAGFYITIIQTLVLGAMNKSCPTEYHQSSEGNLIKLMTSYSEVQYVTPLSYRRLGLSLIGVWKSDPQILQTMVVVYHKVPIHVHHWVIWGVRWDQNLLPSLILTFSPLVIVSTVILLESS